MLLEEPITHRIAKGVSVPFEQEAYGALDLAVVETWDEFEALREDWESLSASAGKPAHVFQQHSWIWHWWRTFLDDKQKPAIVTGRRNGQLVLVVPLVVETQLGVRTASFMGDPVSQYSDVVCDPRQVSNEEVLQALQFAARIHGADLLFARRVREDGFLAKTLQDENARVCDEQVAPALAINRIDSLEDIEGKFSSKMRRNRRRKRKRLHQLGTVSFKMTSAGRDALEAVEQALALKSGWLEHHAIVSNAFSDARFWQFWRGVAASDDRPVGLVAAVMELDGRPIAIEIGLRYKNVHCAHIGAFDIALEKCSPGSSQMDALFEACIADGIVSYDMLAPDDDYKRRIADDFIAVRDYVLAHSTMGRACDLLRLTKGREVAKSAVKGLPRGVRRFIKSALGV